MALQIWLPLRGDVHNQGLYDMGFNNTNATVSANGCLGSCYEFTATTGNGICSAPSSLENFLVNFVDNHSFSICAWVKSTATTQTPAVNITYGIYMSVGPTLKFTLYNSTRTITCAGTAAINDGKWHHCVETYDVSTGEMKVYVDGALDGSAQYTDGAQYVHSWTNNFFIGRNPNNSTANASYFYQGSIQDVRFYDHTLSQKEIKEISKGLLLHYKLDEPCGMSNLLPAGQLAVYNNYSTGMTYTTENIGETYMGMPVRRWTYTVVNSSCASGFKSGYSSRGVHTGISTYFGTSGSTTPFVYWIYYRPHTSGLTAGGVASNIQGWTEIPREYMGDGWWRVGQYRTQVSNASRTSDYVFTSLNWPYAGIGSSCTIDFTDRGILLSGTTSIPETFVEGNSVVPDCSGYGNNGTPVGIIPTDSDTPRYDSCCSFYGNKYIRVGRGPMVKEAITVSMWLYMSAWTGFGSARPISCTETGGWNFEPYSNKVTFIGYASASTKEYVRASDNVNYSTLTGWQHYVGTYDSTRICLYRNGVLCSSAATGNRPIGYNSANGIFIAAEAVSNQTTPTTPYFPGKISDLRIYGTALSAEDVLELYHTAASVDNKGNFYCGELKEV